MTNAAERKRPPPPAAAVAATWGNSPVIAFPEVRSRAHNRPGTEPSAGPTNAERFLVRLRLAWKLRKGPHGEIPWEAFAESALLEDGSPGERHSRWSLRKAALIDFVDAIAVSPRWIRRRHIEALQQAGFDDSGIGALAREISAAIYEATFGELDDVNLPSR